MPVNLNVYHAYQNVLVEFKKKTTTLLEELPENFDKDPRAIIVELANDLATDPEQYRDDLLTLASFLVILVLSTDRTEAKKNLAEMKRNAPYSD